MVQSCLKRLPCSKVIYYELIWFTTFDSNSLNPTMTVTTLLQGGPYSMECLDVLSSVAGCFSLPLS